MKIFIILFFIVLIVTSIFFYLNKKNTQNQLKAHTAKAFVITCMDFRLIDDVGTYLDNIGYHNNYDEFILAGASLGYNQTKYSSWVETLEKHIEIAKNLHDIKEIIVIDHIGCGAYKLFYNLENIEKEKEIQLHIENLEKFKNKINEKYPELTVKTLLMDLNGKIINI